MKLIKFEKEIYASNNNMLLKDGNREREGNSLEKHKIILGQQDALLYLKTDSYSC